MKKNEKDTVIELAAKNAELLKRELEILELEKQAKKQ